MSKNPIIETDRLILRKWVETDFEDFIAINSDPVVMKYFPGILDREETGKLINKICGQFKEDNFGLYATELKNEKKFIGFIGFSRPMFRSFFTPCIEIGWRLSKDFWGHGLAEEGAKACLKFGFSELNFTEVFSFTSSLNLRSEKVMKKIGMKKIGEFNHPMIETENKLYKHVLYKIDRTNSQNH